MYHSGMDVKPKQLQSCLFLLHHLRFPVHVSLAVHQKISVQDLLPSLLQALLLLKYDIHPAYMQAADAVCLSSYANGIMVHQMEHSIYPVDYRSF